MCTGRGVCELSARHVMLSCRVPVHAAWLPSVASSGLGQVCNLHPPLVCCFSCYCRAWVCRTTRPSPTVTSSAITATSAGAAGPAAAAVGPAAAVAAEAAVGPAPAAAAVAAAVQAALVQAAATAVVPAPVTTSAGAAAAAAAAVEVGQAAVARRRCSGRARKNTWKTSLLRSSESWESNESACLLRVVCDG